MNVRGAISRVGSWLAKAAEGQPRPGPWFLPVTGGWLPAQADMWNWWQCGYSVQPGPSRSSIVEACVSAYAQTIAMLPGDHWRLNVDGGKERVTTSALSRLLRFPNAYQTASDFLLNLVRNLYIDGNAYALALRNNRFEIDELHLMESRWSRPYVAETGDVFYSLGGNQVISRQIPGPIMVPQRDVLHVRLHASVRTPWPLMGDSPLDAAWAEVVAAQAIISQQTGFYLNEARPSAVLSTDLVLDKDQVQALRDRWNEQAKGLAAGGTPILTAGLKVQPWSASAKDAQLAEVMKMTTEHIALAYRIPLQILGYGGGTPYASTELLMQSWIASGLGFALNHIETAFDRLFKLRGQPDEYTEFDTNALLRSAQKDRIEALVRGVQGGIFSPNEARNTEGYPDVAYGDEPRVQQQVVPLSAAGAIPAPQAPSSAPPNPAPPAIPANDDNDPEPTKDDIQREIRRIISAAGKVGQRIDGSLARGAR